jgi:hypothetical protein
LRFLAYVKAVLVIKVVLLPDLAFFIEGRTFFEVRIPFLSSRTGRLLADSGGKVEEGLFWETGAGIVDLNVGVVSFTSGNAKLR